MPRTDFETSTSGRILKWALTTFRMIVIVVELVVISGFLSRFWLDIQNSDLDDEMKQKENLIKSYSTFESDFREIQSKLTDYSYISNPNNYALDKIQRITSRVPPDVYLTDIGKEENKITIKADSISELSISQFINALNSDDSLGSVSLKSIDYDQRQAIINFSLELSTKETS